MVESLLDLNDKFESWVRDCNVVHPVTLLVFYVSIILFYTPFALYEIVYLLIRHCTIAYQ